MKLRRFNERVRGSWLASKRVSASRRKRSAEDHHHGLRIGIGTWLAGCRHELHREAAAILAPESLVRDPNHATVTQRCQRAAVLHGAGTAVGERMATKGVQRLTD